MRTIVTIGGGDISDGSTNTIDEHIVYLTGKKQPQVLFIPTASSDAPSYIDVVIAQYQTRMGCNVRTLLVHQNTVPMADMQTAIQTADIIYVGGGNTRMMMNRWQELGIDTLLKQAHARGAIMAGLSAGSICWYESGHSDSLSYEQEDWDYIRTPGLGLIPFIHCPHYNSATNGRLRRQDFCTMMLAEGGIGIAIDDEVAIEWTNEMYKVITNSPTNGAYKVTVHNGKVHEQVLPNDGVFRPIEELL